ncbi:MAG: hypothetical protein P9M14_08715, partial [Candidatus Alcyoniella australis]|nr:hypothetical protein [Candidatus Alcyoniella australis]
MLLIGCAGSAFNKARQADTVQAWQGFADKYPDHPQSPWAQERAAYLGAKSLDTEDAWTLFLQQYPDGSHANRARINLDKAAYHQAQDLNTLTALENYLRRFPQGAYREQAEQRIYSISWAQAEAEHSFDAYENFLREHPDAPQADQAEQGIMLLEAQQQWIFADEADTVSEWDRFITKYDALPQMADQARERREQAAGRFFKGVWLIYAQGMTPAMVLIDADLAIHEARPHSPNALGLFKDRLPTERELNRRGIELRRSEAGRVQTREGDNVRGKLSGERYVVELRRSTTRVKSGWVSLELGPA